MHTEQLKLISHTQGMTLSVQLGFYVFLSNRLLCQACKQLLGTPPYTTFDASSSRNKRRDRTCSPEDGHYLSNKAWCAKRQNSKY